MDWRSGTDKTIIDSAIDEWHLASFTLSMSTAYSGRSEQCDSINIYSAMS